MYDIGVRLCVIACAICDAPDYPVSRKGIYIMAFGDKIRQIRREKGYSQQKLAEKTGLSLRSIQNYESNERYPNNIMIVKNIALALGVTADLLLDDGGYVIEAREKSGIKAAHDVESMLTDINAMFAGGDLSEEDKDKVMRAIMDIYWESKDINKKSRPKKHSPREEL